MNLRKLKQVYNTWYHIYKWQPKLEKETEYFSFAVKIENLAQSLEKNLTPLKFKPSSVTIEHEAVKKIQVFKKKNLNLNRCIVLVELNEEVPVTDLHLFLKTLKIMLGKEIGYIPFLYELGMQVVLIGNDIPIPSKSPIDQVNTFKVLLQSVFVVDNNKQMYYKSVTWGQTVSNAFQKVIDETIQDEINVQ